MKDFVDYLAEADPTGDIGSITYDECVLPAVKLMLADYEQEIVAPLRQLLYDEWVSNHDEHCSNKHLCETFGGKQQCYYPILDEIKALVPPAL